MSLQAYYGSLSASPELSAVNISGLSTRHCNNTSGSCVNTFNMLATPVGGSGSYGYSWSLDGAPDSVELTNDDQPQCTVQVTADVEDPQNEVSIKLDVEVTDLLRLSDPPVTGTITLTSEHELEI